MSLITTKKQKSLAAHPTISLSPLHLAHLVLALQNLEDDLLPLQSLQPWRMKPRELLSHIHRVQYLTIQSEDEEVAEDAKKFIAWLGEPGGRMWEEIVDKLGPVLGELQKTARKKKGRYADIEAKKDTMEFHKFNDLPTELRLLVWKFALPCPQTLEVFRCQKEKELDFDAVRGALQKDLLRLRAVSKEAGNAIAQNGYECIPLMEIGVKYAGLNATLLFNFEIDSLFYTSDSFNHLHPNHPFDAPSAALAKIRNLALGGLRHYTHGGTFTTHLHLRRLQRLKALENLTLVGEAPGWDAWKRTIGTHSVLKEMHTVEQGKAAKARMLARGEMHKEWYALSCRPELSFLNDFKVTEARRVEVREGCMLSDELWEWKEKAHGIEEILE